MQKQIRPTEHPPEEDHAKFEGAATRLERHLDRLGVTEKDLLDAADKVCARMLTEVYGLEPEALRE